MSAGQLTDELRAELERMAVRALAGEYNTINRTLFGGKLKRPTLALSETGERLGAWDSQWGSITLARGLITGKSWGVVVEILKHEMAHQFVDEVLGVQEPTAHGPLFRRVCQERAIDAATAGFGPSRDGTEASVPRKISQLLALAESGERHEAEAAMAAAQRLMLKYNIETTSTNPGTEYRFAHLGKPSGRVDESSRALASLLRDYFFVQVLWVSVWRPLEGMRGSVIEVCGTPANVELAEYVHEFLIQAANRLWREHKRAKGISRDAERRRFAAGVMSGFSERLSQERAVQTAEGLVWLGDAELLKWIKRRYPRTRSISYLVSRGTQAHQAGHSAGSKLVLHRGVTAGPSGPPKQLGSGR